MHSNESPPHGDHAIAVTYVDSIPKNAKPADLPVQQATKFELIVNLKIAKGLSLTIPSGVLAIADEVIATDQAIILVCCDALDFRSGSFTTDAFSTRADQCPL
jgi:hypothetical protein